MKRWTFAWVALSLLAGCRGETPALGGGGDGASGDTTGGEPAGPPAPLCADPGPLLVGDAQWVKPPFAPPGDGGAPGENGGDDGWGGGGFLEDPDGGGVSFECDIWAQDCPQGEKCVPWANDGSGNWNASRCSPIDDMPGMAGDACTVEGGPTSGIDDCDGGSICWDVDRLNEGTCTSMCQGDESMPQCARGEFCFIANDGAVALCLPEATCEADGMCHCMCRERPDPDCEPDQCAPMENASPPDELVTEPPVHLDGEEVTCPDTHDPLVVYMSNDDSNSQASPILARATIASGQIPSTSRIRIHEFLNYYDFNGDTLSDQPATVGMQMRRTNAEEGEFTLVLQAHGQRLHPDDRPPMNLVFSLDTSGSMGGQPIELLRETMLAAAGQLKAGDVVSMVTWSTSQAVELDGYAVMGPDDPALLAKIDTITSNGGTDLHAGLVAAYQLANAHHMPGGINRVVLVSDGGANAGVTDLDLIASEASGADGMGTYLVGVGVGTPFGYRDDLMDAVTDAGKGAYIFVDKPAEAYTQLGDRFLANVAVSARNVRMALTLPWYFGIKRFHGEEYSENPAEVEPQHLAPNDTMTFHQVISACEPGYITTCDSITASVEYLDPITGTAHSDELTVPVETLVQQPALQLRKADVVVGYAKALIVIDHLVHAGERDRALEVAENMEAWSRDAAAQLEDDELQEIADIMGTVREILLP